MGITLDLLHGVTDAELLRLSQRNPGYQFERTAEGRLTVSPTGGDSGRRSGEVFLQLGVWNRRIQQGVVFDSSTGFDLADGSCLSPDASWVRRQRWEALTPQERGGFVPLAPDAAFEVRSASDRLSALRSKMRSYVANGVRLAVLVDAPGRTVEVYRPGQEPVRHQHPDGIALDPELPGFTLEFGPVWSDEAPS